MASEVFSEKPLSELNTQQRDQNLDMWSTAWFSHASDSDDYADHLLSKTGCHVSMRRNICRGFELHKNRW